MLQSSKQDSFFTVSETSPTRIIPAGYPSRSGRSAEGIARSPCEYQESPKNRGQSLLPWPPSPRSDLAASRSQPQDRPPRPALAFPAHFAAPYLQISSSDAGDMAADMAVTGEKYYTLAFLISQSGCTPDWEDGGSSLGTFNSQISALQAAGGNVIISSGGAGATELAQTCTNVSQLTAAYQNVVNTNGSTRLDFDIEDSVLADTAATSLRDQALAALQAQDPAVQVDFTLGVSPQGLPTGTGSQYALLQDAKAKGVKVSAVNIMTMDFGAGSNDLADAESAAQGAAGQLASLYGISTSAAYGMMGLTPIAGTNDDGTDFSTANASVAGELRRLQRRRGAVLLGGRRLRQGDRLPVLVDLQQDHREQRRRRRHHDHRADHRVPGPVPG